jgi:hypothetical protein
LTGKPHDCPAGQDYVQASLGPYEIGALCVSAEERKRWFPAARLDDQPLFVRVLVVRGRELPSAGVASCLADDRPASSQPATHKDGARGAGTEQ